MSRAASPFEATTAFVARKSAIGHPSATNGVSDEGTLPNTSRSSVSVISRRSPLNSFSAELSASRTAAFPMHETRHLSRQRALCMPTIGLASARRLELVDLRAIEEREVLQVPPRVAIVDVEPELIELVRLRQRRIEPHRARFGLAELRSRRGRHQRHHDAVRLSATDATNQIHSSGDVAPLIAAAHLQRAAVPVVAARGSRTPGAASS